MAGLGGLWQGHPGASQHSLALQPSQTTAQAQALKKKKKKCASCCSEPHTLRPQGLSLPGAAPLALIQLLTNKRTHHFLAG